MNEFDKYADKYEKELNRELKISGETANYFAEYKALYAISFLQKKFKGKILDYGCGTGLLSIFLVKYFKDSTLHGYDISKESIRIINSELCIEGHFTSDREKLDKNYNLIIISNVMHHIGVEQRLNVIMEIYQRMTTEGKIILFEHNPANPLTKYITKKCSFDKDAILLRPKEALYYLKKSNFSIVSKDYIDFFPKWFSFLRPIETLLSWCPLGAQYAIVGKI